MKLNNSFLSSNRFHILTPNDDEDEVWNGCTNLVQFENFAPERPWIQITNFRLNCLLLIDQKQSLVTVVEA